MRDAYYQPATPEQVAALASRKGATMEAAEAALERGACS